MARRKLLKVLGSFDRPGRDILARNAAIADLAMFALRPWRPPEPKDKGLAPDPIKRDRWHRNLTPPNEKTRLAAGSIVALRDRG